MVALVKVPVTESRSATNGLFFAHDVRQDRLVEEDAEHLGVDLLRYATSASVVRAAGAVPVLSPYR